jgi:hypothetical protein
MNVTKIGLQLIGLTIITTLIISCTKGESCSHYPPYTEKLLQIAIPATEGDLDAATNGWEECAGIVKIDRFDTRYNNLGVCAPFAYLRTENALATGDPAIIRGYLGALEDSGGPGFANRIGLYKEMARPIVQSKCMSAHPPKGCVDKEALKWLDEPPPPVKITRSGPQFR